MNRGTAAGRFLTRALFHFTWLFTSVYALLAYVPFTFRQVLSIELIPGLNRLASLQPTLLAVATLALAAFIVFVEKRKRLSPEDRGELIVLVVISLGVAAWNLPARLANETSSLVWSLLSLIPVAWLAFFDLRAPIAARTEGESSMRILASGGASAVAVALGFVIAGRSSGVEVAFVAIAAAGAASALLCLLEQCLYFSQAGIRARFLSYSLLLALLFGAFTYARVCASISFFGPAAAVWSFAFCGALVFAAVGTLITRGPAVTRSSLDRYGSRFLLLPLSVPGALLSFAIHLAFIGFVVRKMPAMDWNGLGQQLAALVILVSFFFRFHSLFSVQLKPRLERWAPVAIGLVALVVFGTLYARREEVRHSTSTDPLFALVKPVLFPASGDLERYRYLQSHTGLPRSARIQLKEIDLPPRRAHVPSQKPHVFVFVIDSLRRDYLSPFNAQVTFTPNVAKLAAESVVFQNAFTRYGATGLSEPSIWAGRMFPHQMYPEPFSAINLTEKLMEAEGYESWVSRDSILNEILRPSAGRDLDVGVGTQELDLCRTTREISSRLETPPEKPVFVYTQSQNIHVSVLARSKIKEGPAGFHAPYAKALEEIDACLGEFVESLKSKGLFEKSVIVLTADHGDSLGEEGRFGHAYTVYPEVLRIPLLIHLPKAIKAKAIPERDVVFSTDIAPSLAFLLGRDPKPAHWSEGRSLFFETEATEPLEKEHLVVSSYGPVAGLLTENGSSVFILDAINFGESLYRINETGSVRTDVTPETRDENDVHIKEKLDQLHSHFGL